MLLEMLRPFVYRRYLDFSAIEALRTMKQLIQQEVRRKGMADNIKLGSGGIREVEFIAQAFQLIWPYSDFLLHDMGEGLADGQAVADATGREWRTPPLWGIGLTQEVSGHSFFLHDGRARNLTEAILWHGGEAEAARNAFAAANPEDRKALITFLESL